VSKRNSAESGWSLESPASPSGSVPSGAGGRIGRAIEIRGAVVGKEDLVVDGVVDGKITLPEHHLVLGPPARTTAEVSARVATLRGRHRGNASATERLEVTSSAVVIGDLRAPRLVVQEGAKLRGTILMEVRLPPDLEEPRPAAKKKRSNE
jgi:cytoskeletal protein CcmA (bactofilin family)